MKENGLDCFYPYLELIKLKAPFLIAWSWATFATFFQTYIFNNWSFLIYLTIAVVIDTILGVWKAVKHNQVSSAKMGGFVVKVVLYGLFLVMVNSLSNFSSANWSKLFFSYIQESCYAAVMIREAISIIENIGAIKPDLLPKWILKKLRSFDETGTYKIENQ